jgi:quercetin dioxygenase-like cupin family protein
MLGSMDNISLTALSRELLELARRNSSGRSARTVHGGHEHRLRQTVIALAAGRSLDEHESPEEATVHVLQGRVRLVAGEVSWPGAAGHLIEVPAARHVLAAEEDSVVLLTAVVPR